MIKPLSPHLSIYKFSITMLMSIFHRASGFVLYFSTLLITIWLASIAQGKPAYQIVENITQYTIAKIILVAVTFTFIHHLYGGIRYLVLDFSKLYDKNIIVKMAHATWIMSFITTIAIWLVICI